MEIAPNPASEKPVVYVLHGDDTFAMARFVDALYARMGDPATAELNTSRLEGRRCSEEDLRLAAGTPPFLLDRRLVILTAALAYYTSPDSAARFAEFADTLPPTTALVLMIEDALERRQWRALPQTHWLRQWVAAAGRRALLKTFSLPQIGEMPRWIQGRAKELGGSFSVPASQMLASLVSNDTRQANLEIDKLLNYVNYQRPVEAQDVEELCTAGGQATVFEMVDAAAAGDAVAALRALHRLLEEQDANALFGMLVRQFRLVLLAREVLDEGGNVPQVENALGVHAFVAEKVTHQARRFSRAALTTIYRRLLEIDREAKSGGMELELSLDTLIAELDRSRATSFGNCL